MAEGVITKSLSGFYYVTAEDQTLECRARGSFRKEGISPLVGDKVEFEDLGKGKGVVNTIHPRRNAFVRPAVANIDLLVFLAAAVIPVTDPYLIDRVAAIAESVNCDVVLCINKADVDHGDELAEIYRNSGFECAFTRARSSGRRGQQKTWPRSPHNAAR